MIWRLLNEGTHDRFLPRDISKQPCLLGGDEKVQIENEVPFSTHPWEVYGIEPDNLLP